MNRLFIGDTLLKKNLSLPLQGEDAHYVIKVLRMRKGEKIALFDRTGGEFEAVLQEVSRDQAIVMPLTPILRNAEPGIRITLAQALPRGEKMDYLLQKCTEIGVSAVIPCLSSRATSRPLEKSYQHKLARWKKISREAAEQSGRSIIPEVESVIGIDALLEKMKDYDLALMAWERENIHIKGLLQGLPSRPQSILMAVGPEGGFTDEEAALFSSRGGRTVSLGPRILRTETAGPIMLALILYELDDFDNRAGGQAACNISC